MRDTIVIRNSMTISHGLGNQIGEGLIDSNIDELIEGLESGRYKLVPSFMKDSSGNLKILEISVVPDEFIYA